MNNPKISVIIPLFNHEKYIKEAVYSVLEQTFSDLELIIINDGSIDGSEEIVKQIKDERIKYYYQKNKGAHNTINRGIKLAKGEYISILNSDDVYYTNRFEEFLEILEDNNSINAVFSHIEFIDDQGNFTKYHGAKDNWTSHDSETSFKDENNIILDLLAGNFLITTSNLFCRKSVFQDIGLFQNLKYTHDYEFFLRLCYHFKVHIINLSLLTYRIHDLNTYNLENEAETEFEVGIILSNFFLNYDLKKVLPEDDIYTNMMKFINSINTFSSEKMIMTLLIFALNYTIHDKFFKDLTENLEIPFRKISIDYFQTYLNMWDEAQEDCKKWAEKDKKLSKMWKKLCEVNNRLSESEKKLSEANEKLVEIEKKLIEKTQQTYFLLNSRSYRLGSFLTWPVRKLLSLKKAMFPLNVEN
ncbi:MAG: glycosyltransferase [Deltaproteobacteria bacterium]|nr:glycosyltransferase [Deltaproteobacteria bacterium]